jgi:hypothetical protein
MQSLFSHGVSLKCCFPTTGTIQQLCLKVITKIKISLKRSRINNCAVRVTLLLLEVFSTFHYLHLTNRNK